MITLRESDLGESDLGESDLGIFPGRKAVSILCTFFDNGKPSAAPALSVLRSEPQATLCFLAGSTAASKLLK